MGVALGKRNSNSILAYSVTLDDPHSYLGGGEGPLMSMRSFSVSLSSLTPLHFHLREQNQTSMVWSSHWGKQLGSVYHLPMWDWKRSFIAHH